MTVKNRLEERYREKLLEALAIYQEDFNERHGLGRKIIDGKCSSDRSDET